MKNLRLLAVCVASVCLGGSVFLVACSDDSAVNPTTDAGPSPESSTFDSPAADTGADTGTDAETDAGLKTETFAAQVADKICQSLARCCYGNANLDAGAPVDGGSYDQAACLTHFTTTGFEGSSIGSTIPLTAGNVSVDQTKGTDCLAKIAAITCDVPGAEYLAAASACYESYVGKLADGAPCRGSIECSSASFCQAATASTDGGVVGTCAPLRAVGAPCGDFTSDINVADEACSFRASGVPAFHCDSVADFTTQDLKPTADWVCAANVATGGNCVNSNWCASGVCNPDNGFTCEDPNVLFADSCPVYTK